MDFEQLRIFLILAEEGTYLGAANRLATSRSRVRRKLDQLEREAATPLIHRDQGVLRLTPAGEVLAERGRDLLEEADHLIRHVHEVGTIPSGRLKIAMPTGPPIPGWSRIRENLQSRFPDLHIDLRFDPNPSALLPGQAEIAITFEEELPRGCSAITLGEYPFRLFVSADYLLAHGSPQTIGDLKNHRVAMWRSPNRPQGRIRLRDGRDLVLEPHFITNDAALMFRMATEGSFIAYLPELPTLSDPSLKTLFDDLMIERVCERLAIPDVLADLPRIRELVALTRQSATTR